MNAALKSALLAVLRPLVRYLVGQGCTYGTLADLLKMVYVEETIRHYKSTGGRSLTDSHLTLMTGIHRKEVKRLREMLAEQGIDIALSADANVAAKVVALWGTQSGFQSADNLPLALPLRAADGLDFETLTRLAKADMRPRAILDELIRAGVAQVDVTDGLIRLMRMAYVPDTPEDKLVFFGQNIGDHLQSAVHNMEQSTPFIERALFFDALPIETLDTIKPELEQMGSQLLMQAHEIVSRNEAVHQPAANANQYRMRFGVYYYQEKSSDEVSK